MRDLRVWAHCLLGLPVLACGPSKNNPGNDAGAKDSVLVENVVEKQETDLTDDPQKLADFAVECFRTNEREKLLPYATERCKGRLNEDMAIEAQMKDDRGIREMRERLLSTSYTCSQVSDMGSAGKLMKYSSNPSKYDMKVLLEQQDGRWLVDHVGPDR